MKKPKSVIAAEEALAAKVAEVAAAREALKRLEREQTEAWAAVGNAQAEADASLPQCDMVRVKWRSGKEEAMGRAVILRFTPSGTMVVRRVGASGPELKYKWAEYSAKFKLAAKIGFADDTQELRNVPDEYLPDVTLARPEVVG